MVRRLSPHEPSSAPSNFYHAEHLKALQGGPYRATRHSHPSGEFWLVRQPLAGWQHAIFDEFSQPFLDDVGERSALVAPQLPLSDACGPFVAVTPTGHVVATPVQMVDAALH